METYLYEYKNKNTIGTVIYHIQDVCEVSFILVNLENDLKEFIYHGLKYAREKLQYQGDFYIQTTLDDPNNLVYEQFGFRYDHQAGQKIYYRKRKIQNIIFDNGNVLTTFSPSTMIHHYFDQDEALIQEVVFGDIWNDLDQGIIEEKDALTLFLSKLPPIHHLSVTKMFHEWHIFLKPKEEMYRYMLEIKNQYHFYLLSNAGIRHEVFKHQIPALALMEGMVVSYQLKINKPDERIYQALLTKYHLDPEVTLMIDDKKENILAARKLGMFGYEYHDDLDHLQQVIQYLGV